MRAFPRHNVIQSGLVGCSERRMPCECLSEVDKYPTNAPTVAHTSTATIENVKMSPSLVTAPPLKISGAAHVVVPATLMSWGGRVELSSRPIDVSPKSVRRAWPFLSTRTFTLEFVSTNIRTRRSGDKKAERLTPFRFPCIIPQEWRYLRPSATSHNCKICCLERD